ncbi:MAG: DUF418 domain-containing protein [Phycisphaerales bacterium]
MTTFAPTVGTERITAIDAVRGFALLGILCVNIQSFAEPFGMFVLPELPAGATAADLVSFYFVKIFCESKFYPLFAMLFGFGLMMQADRARGRGTSYWGPGIRRYVFLGFLGLLHGLLLWYGDILFLYGIGGMFVLLMHRVSTKAMAITGSVFLFIALVLMTLFAYISTPGQADAVTANESTVVVTAPAAPTDAAPTPDAVELTDAAPIPEGGAPKEMPPAAPPSTEDNRAIRDGKIEGIDTPLFHLFEAMGEGKGQEGPSDPVWMQYERQAYTNGNPLDRLLFNAFNWSMFLIVCLVGFGWHVIAMLLFGAVLYRVGLFDPARDGRLKKMLLLGALVGLPMCLLGALASKFMAPNAAAALLSANAILFGPLLSLGYLAAIALAVNARVAAPLTGALANVGRLALTNYLTQTVVCSFLFYEWGLHLYDQTTRGQRLGIVAAIFVAQVIFSTLYLKVFRMGPMEWLWRCVTYLRLPGKAAG